MLHRVSIGLPVYNGDDFISAALSSILAQTFEDFELIICDNASTDGTEEICCQYAAGNSRISYYRNEKNIGAAANYNRVFELSSGEYFKWAAHDDKCDPEHLSKCVEVLDNCSKDTVLCFPETTLIDGEDNFISQYDEDVELTELSPDLRLRYLLRHIKKCNSIYGLIRSQALKGTKLVGNYHASDVVLLAELALLGKFYLLRENLFYRRMHPCSSRQMNRTNEEVAVWFDPNNKGRIILPICNLFKELLRSVKWSQLTYPQKMICYATVIDEWLNRYWRVMGGELKLGLKDSYRRILFNGKSSDGNGQPKVKP